MLLILPLKISNRKTNSKLPTNSTYACGQSRCKCKAPKYSPILSSSSSSSANLKQQNTHRYCHLQQQQQQLFLLLLRPRLFFLLLLLFFFFFLGSFNRANGSIASACHLLHQISSGQNSNLNS
jgi:hypothetical protein